MAPGQRAELAGRVKALCRARGRAGGIWRAWCDAHAGGSKDPNRLPAAALQRFLAAYHSGALGAERGRDRRSRGKHGTDTLRTPYAA